MTQQKRRLGLTIPETLYDKISDKAQYHGKTINSTCLDIFWEYFESKRDMAFAEGERERR